MRVVMLILHVIITVVQSKFLCYDQDFDIITSRESGNDKCVYSGRICENNSDISVFKMIQCPTDKCYFGCLNNNCMTLKQTNEIIDFYIVVQTQNRNWVFFIMGLLIFQVLAFCVVCYFNVKKQKIVLKEEISNPKKPSYEEILLDLSKSLNSSNDLLEDSLHDILGILEVFGEPSDSSFL